MRKLAAGILCVPLLFPTQALADRFTLLAFGDSLTQGYGLAENDGFVPQLERWLAGQGADVAVINAGVSGDTTAGGAARIDWALTDEVDGVIVALGANDVLRGLDPAEAKANLGRILSAIAGRDLPALLVGIPAPPNYGPEYKDAFDALYPSLAETYGAPLYPNFLGALGDGQSLASAAAFMQGDGTHPNAEGVARIVAAMGPEVLKLIDSETAGE